LARCVVDHTTSPTLARLLRKLKKKYPHIEDDLAAVIPEIAADYTAACNAARPPKRKIQWEFWKYDFGSSDLRRHPRESFRVIGIFLVPEESGKERTMYLCIAFFKGDQPDVSNEEITKAVGQLMMAVSQSELTEDEPSGERES
jgi:hypothetical protein